MASGTWSPVGGATLGGSAPVSFSAGDNTPVDIDLVVEWDFDGDGDFSDDVEDITSYVVSAETLTGRDWPSSLTGKAAAGQLKLMLLNEDDRFSHFNSSSPLNQSNYGLDVGRKIRVRAITERAVDLPSNDGVSTPDHVDLETTDFDIRLELTFDSIGGGAPYLVSKGTTTNGFRAWTLSYSFLTGLNMVFNDGTISQLAVFQSGDLDLSDGTRVAVRVTVDSNDGGGGSDASFYTAPTLDGPWTLVGTDTDSSFTPFDSSEALTLGRLFNSTGGMNGRLHRFEMRDGIDGTVVANPDFRRMQIGETTLTDDTGKVWTLSGDAVVINETGLTIAEPVVLAQDHFGGSVGILGTDEVGNTWTDRTIPDFARDSDTAGITVAVPEGLGSDHVATVDVDTVDCMLQARWRHIDYNNQVGLVYRLQNSNNFGMASINPLNNSCNIALYTMSSGVLTTDTSVSVEYRADDFIGLHVVGDDATVYHNGVAVLTSSAAYSSTYTNVGIYSGWENQRAPAIQEFYAWDKRPEEIEGILWTGYVSQVAPSVVLGPQKFCEVSAEGPLSIAAGLDIKAPNSVGSLTTEARGPSSVGSTAGEMIGSCLGRAGLLQPGGEIQQGDITLGSSAHADGKALEMMRLFEEAEIGFLYETQEGYITFENRTDREESSSEAWFGDTTDAQFGYHEIVPFDWRSQIFNRVQSRVAPVCPWVLPYIGENTAASEVIIPMPDASNLAEVGDLFLIFIAPSVSESGVEWALPVGWTEYRDGKDQPGKIRIYAKTVETDDIDDDVTFLSTSTGSGDFVSFNMLVKDWYGDLKKGLALSDVTGFGAPNSQSRANIGDNEPAAVVPDWGPGPSAFITFRAGMVTTSAMDVDETTDVNFVPDGFSDAMTFKSAVDCAVQAGYRNANDAILKPSRFITDADDGGAFGGLDQVETVTIAIRGYSGDDPEITGGQIITTEDTASQQRHKLIRTYEAASVLFATVTDAEDYNNLILAKFADDRPIVQISFHATKSAAYRDQAINRRVSDKVHITADGEVGLGIDGDFFIENITHRFPNAAQWIVTWQLSPA